MIIDNKTKLKIFGREVCRCELKNGKTIWGKTRGYDYQVFDSKDEFDTEKFIPYAYARDTEKWYVLNNKNEYEEYGVYEQVSSTANTSFYEGKLIILGNSVYRNENGDWYNKGKWRWSDVAFTPAKGLQCPSNFKIKIDELSAVGTYFEFACSSGNDTWVARLADASYNLNTGYGSFTYVFRDGTVSTEDGYVYFKCGGGTSTINRVDKEPTCQIYVDGPDRIMPIEYDEHKFDLYEVYDGFYYKQDEDVIHDGYNVIVNIDRAIRKYEGIKYISALKGLNDVYLTFSTNDIIDESKLNEYGLIKIYDYFFNDYNPSKPSHTYYSILKDNYSVGVINTLSPINYTSAIIPSCVKRIEGSAFANTEISELTIGENVNFIHQDAFLNCPNLNHITCLGTEEILLGYDLNGLPESGELETPNSTEDWSDFLSHLPSGWKQIKN